MSLEHTASPLTRSKLGDFELMCRYKRPFLSHPQVLLEFDDGSSQRLTLGNSRDPTLYALPAAVDDVASVRVTIESTHITPCVFPATYNGDVYAGCIGPGADPNVNDPWGRSLPWCATEVQWLRHHCGPSLAHSSAP